MAENFPNLVEDINLQIQATEQTPNRINPKKFPSKHIRTNLLKTNKEKNPKTAREKGRDIDKGKPTCMTAHFSSAQRQQARDDRSES